MSTENPNSKEVQNTDNVKTLLHLDLTDCTDELLSDLYQHIIELQDDLASVSKEYNTYFDSDIRPLVEPLAYISGNVQNEVRQRETLDEFEVVSQARQRD